MAMLRKIVESFFGNPVMHLRREDRLKSKRNTPNQSGGVFLRVFREGFLPKWWFPERRRPRYGVGWQHGRARCRITTAVVEKPLKTQMLSGNPPLFQGAAFVFQGAAFGQSAKSLYRPSNIYGNRAGGSIRNPASDSSLPFTGILPDFNGSVRCHSQLP
jgi:hypothetical protein